MASAGGVMESMDPLTAQPRAPFVHHQPAYKPGFGVQVAQQLLTPMVVDHQFVQHDPSFGGGHFTGGIGRVSSSGYSDSGRVGTPALGRSYPYPMGPTGSQGVLLQGGMQTIVTPVNSLNPGNDRHLLGSGRRQGSFGRLGSEPGSLSGTWNMQNAAEMLTINEDGFFNAEDHSVITEGAVTPRNGNAVGVGGAMPNYQTPRRQGSGRALSSVTESGGLAFGIVDPSIGGGVYPARGVGSSAGRVPSASGRVGTPMVRGSTPYVGDTNRGFSSSGRQLGSSSGRPNISAHGRVRQGSANLIDNSNPLMAQDEQPTRIMPVRTGENVPMWLRNDQGQQIMTVVEETSPPAKDLPMWLQAEANQQSSQQSSAARPGDDTLNPSWLEGGQNSHQQVGGAVTPREQQERIPTAGMGRARNRGPEIPDSDLSGGGRPGTSRGVDMLLC